MGKDAVDKFYERMGEDETMQKAYAEAMDRASVEAVASFAGNNGFEFTADELVESWADQAAELSEEDLDNVAGGGSMMIPSMGTGFAMSMLMKKCGEKCGKFEFQSFAMKKCDDKCGKLF
jgi:predicted ribosomally synthesized peptide with nif11-like leader